MTEPLAAKLPQGEHMHVLAKSQPFRNDRFHHPMSTRALRRCASMSKYTCPRPRRTGHAFPAYPASPLGAASLMSLAAGMPGTPAGAASLAAMSAAAGGLPYVPVPVPMMGGAAGMLGPLGGLPAMMGQPGVGGVAAPIQGFLLPYQQDMYQALYDRLVSAAQLACVVPCWA